MLDMYNHYYLSGHSRVLLSYLSNIAPIHLTIFFYLTSLKISFTIAN
jgi:hypothetical protein